MACLVSELQPLVVTASVHGGHWVGADLARVSFGVGEGEGPPEGTLDQGPVLAKHAEQLGVPFNVVAQRLGRLNQSDVLAVT